MVLSQSSRYLPCISRQYRNVVDPIGFLDSAATRSECARMPEGDAHPLPELLGTQVLELNISFRKNTGGFPAEYPTQIAWYPRPIRHAAPAHHGSIPARESKFLRARKFVSRIFLNNSICSRRRLVAIISCFERSEREPAALERI